MRRLLRSNAGRRGEEAHMAAMVLATFVTLTRSRSMHKGSAGGIYQ